MKNFVLIFLFLVISSMPATAERPLTVFAAASLSTVLPTVMLGWQGEVSISYGGSGVLARQVALGAPADLVLLANPRWMRWLEKTSAVEPATRVDLLSNRLVVIGTVGSPAVATLTPEMINVLLSSDRLSIGQTHSVPAGQYGKAFLQYAGLWESVKHRLAEAENVRVALSYVARQEAPLGIVYATDALAEPRVTPIFEIPSESHPPILYPLALRIDAPASALKLWQYLQSAAASEVFSQYGFLPPSPKAAK